MLTLLAKIIYDMFIFNVAFKLPIESMSTGGHLTQGEADHMCAMCSDRIEFDRNPNLTTGHKLYVLYFVHNVFEYFGAGVSFGKCSYVKVVGLATSFKRSPHHTRTI